MTPPSRKHFYLPGIASWITEGREGCKLSRAPIGSLAAIPVGHDHEVSTPRWYAHLRSAGTCGTKADVQPGRLRNYKDTIVQIRGLGPLTVKSFIELLRSMGLKK